MAERPGIRTIDLAHDVGVSRQQIAKWSKEGLEAAAKIGYGRWDRERALAWIADRREDELPEGVTVEDGETLVKTRTRLYAAQTDYQELRNDLARGVLLYRDAASRAMNEYAAQQIADLDAWARDTSDDSAAVLKRKGLTAADIVAVKAEVANGLRSRQTELVGRVLDVLGTVEDVGAARIRLSRPVG